MPVRANGAGERCGRAKPERHRLWAHPVVPRAIAASRSKTRRVFHFQLTSLNRGDIVVYREASRRTRAWPCGEAVPVISVRSRAHQRRAGDEAQDRPQGGPKHGESHHQHRPKQWRGWHSHGRLRSPASNVGRLCPRARRTPRRRPVYDEPRACSRKACPATATRPWEGLS
jgi:hypothetical protein